ncbi:UNVERIFIED_CONTAM: hypothetical protein NCL1_56417 [Trichonephila clavipes]
MKGTIGLTDNHGSHLVMDLSKYITNRIKIKIDSKDAYNMEYCTLLYMNKSYNGIQFSEIFRKHMDLFLELVDQKECRCNDYRKYVDEYHGHVVKGNL